MRLNSMKIVGISTVVVLVIVLLIQGYWQGTIAKKTYFSKACYMNNNYSNYNHYYDYQAYANTGFLPEPLQNVSINLKVANFAQTQTAITTILSRNLGIAISLSTYEPPAATHSGTFLFSVPHYLLSQTMWELRQLGVNEGESYSDLNNYTPDYQWQNRLEQLKEQKNQLLRAYSERTTPQSSRLIESELTSINEQMRSLEGGGRASISQTNDRVNISVTYYDHKTSPFKVMKDAGRGLTNFFFGIFQGFVFVINGIIAVLGYLLPVIVWIGLISGGIYILVRWFRT